MIKAIYITEKHKQPLTQVSQIDCVAGKGIIGDRHYGKRKWPGQNLTLIEAEAIEQFNRDLGQSINWQAPRRNIITQGIRLNDLVGQFFMLGNVQCFGVEQCEPCRLLGRDLENERVSSQQVIQAFKHSGGLRADIVTDGWINVGDALITID